jgi:5-methylcytosine-specific restriction endonuclease McrA
VPLPTREPRAQNRDRAGGSEEPPGTSGGGHLNGERKGPARRGGAEKGGAGETGAGSDADWQQWFCTFECHKQFSVRVSGSEIRRQIFELERGVCQLCGKDMHTFWLEYKALEAPERMQKLMGTRFAVTQRILNSPVEGDFWQADHIVAVAEGGGDADLSNLRTLCTPCHKSETERLHKRLVQRKNAEAAAGSNSIAALFRRQRRQSPGPAFENSLVCARQPLQRRENVAALQLASPASREKEGGSGVVHAAASLPGLRKHPEIISVDSSSESSDFEC